MMFNFFIVTIVPLLVVGFIAYKHSKNYQLPPSFYKSSYRRQGDSFWACLHRLIPLFGLLKAILIVLYHGILGFPIYGRSAKPIYFTLQDSLFYALVINICLLIYFFISSYCK